jgi:hypothetical protein
MLEDFSQHMIYLFIYYFLIDLIDARIKNCALCTNFISTGAVYFGELFFVIFVFQTRRKGIHIFNGIDIGVHNYGFNWKYYTPTNANK